jgi:hypothetical protein
VCQHFHNWNISFDVGGSLYLLFLAVMSFLIMQNEIKQNSIDQANHRIEDEVLC